MKYFLALFLLFAELQAQTLFAIHQTQAGKAFTPVTDTYPFDENNELIEAQYRKWFNEKTYNSHVLNGVRRSTFLAKANILESDSIFVFNALLDTVFRYEVNKCLVRAELSPYAYEAPFQEFDFLIGFEFADLRLDDLGDWHQNSFVSIGKSNPFNNGKCSIVRWTRLDSSSYDLTPLDPDIKAQMQHLQRTALFMSFTKNYIIYALEFGRRHRYVKVLNSHTQEAIGEDFFRASEGTMLNSLFGTKENQRIPQYSGKILKDHAPVLIGMQSQSFGCEPIVFLDFKTPRLYPNCENRH